MIREYIRLKIVSIFRSYNEKRKCRPKELDDEENSDFTASVPGDFQDTENYKYFYILRIAENFNTSSY